MEKYQFIQNSVELFLSIDNWDEREIVGCSKTEIIELKKLLPTNAVIPKSFEEFLLFGGKRLGRFLGDPIFLYSDLIEYIKEKYKSLDEEFKLEKKLWDYKILIIDEHLSSSFTFLKLNKEELDPPVFIIRENEQFEAAKKITGHFSEFLFKTVSTWKLLHDKSVRYRFTLQGLINKFKREALDLRDLLNTLDIVYPESGFNSFADYIDKLSLSIYEVYSASIYKNVLDEIGCKLNIEESLSPLFTKTSAPMKKEVVTKKINHLKQLINQIESIRRIGNPNE